VNASIPTKVLVRSSAILVEIPQENRSVSPVPFCLLHLPAQRQIITMYAVEGNSEKQLMLVPLAKDVSLAQLLNTSVLPFHVLKTFCSDYLRKNIQLTGRTSCVIDDRHTILVFDRELHVSNTFVKAWKV
jgi:hypothetical protein